MSLLDDVSIVVTPNGYKAGTLYGVLPTATLGSELVVNSDFSSDYWWGTDPSWTISGGSANSNGTGTMYKGGVLIIGKRYKVTVDISAYTSGSLTYPNASHTLPSAIGTYTFNYTAASQTVSFSGSSFVGSIDNVSVKEFTASDMDVTRATAATRVDENGLVNYAEVLGSEEVTNGDFATDSDWTLASGWSIGGGKLSSSSTSTWGPYYTLGAATVGKAYKLKFSIVDYTSGTVVIRCGGTQSSGFSALGDYEVILVASVASNSFAQFKSSSSFTGSVDNVSVKEVTRNNVPRIDYTGGGCPHILAEPQRTNIFIQNDISTWSGFGSYAGNTTAPDGTTINFVNMEDIRIFPSTTISNSTEYTSSIYLKGNKTADVKLRNASESDTVITLSTEWQRFELTTTSISTITNALLIDARFSQGMGATGLEVAIYGGQIEEGSYPTSYIPTSGSSVTRNQDQFSRDGIGSLINSTEGVLFVESSVLSNDGTYKAFSLSDGTTSNTIRFYTTPTLNQLAIRVTVAGVHQFNVVYTLTDLTVLNKMALKYKSNDFAFWVNGVEVKTSTSGNTYTANTLNSLQFDRGDGVDTFFGKVKQLQVYDTALTDMQLIQLTGTAGTDFYESYSEMAESLTYTIQ